jgi:uncharacterized protein with HEPN domain
MHKNPVEFLRHILENIELAQRFVKGFTVEDLKKDIEKQYSLIRCFEIIGEATNSIPDKIKKDNKEIPWREMNDFRNYLIHEYFGVNVVTIWSTIKDDLPPLKKQIKQLIKDLS